MYYTAAKEGLSPARTGLSANKFDTLFSEDNIKGSFNQNGTIH
jgi:hypothetical protein